MITGQKKDYGKSQGHTEGREKQEMMMVEKTAMKEEGKKNKEYHMSYHGHDTKTEEIKKTSKKNKIHE